MSEIPNGKSLNGEAGPRPGAATDRTWRALTWLGLSLAALVGMGQVGAIVQEAIPTGAISVTTLYGPGQVLSTNFSAAATI